MSLAAARLLPHTGVRDIMVDIRGKWGQEHYAPRHASHYPRDESQPAHWRASRHENHQETQRTRHLPPASWLVSDVHYNQGLPLMRAQGYYDGPEGRESYAHAATDAPRLAAPAPSTNSDSFPPPLGSNNRRPSNTGACHSPVPSPSPSGRSGDVPEDLRLGRLGDQLLNQPPRPRPQMMPLHELPPKRKSIAGIQQTRSPHDVPLSQIVQNHSSQGKNPVPRPWPTQPEMRASERMKIADLLSNEQSTGGPERPAKLSQLMTQKSPQRDRPATFDWKYDIHIRQQPIAARSCGYGERDRRVVDPPPIVEMTIIDPSASEDEINERLTHSSSMMLCTIWNEKGDEDMSSMPEDYRTQRRLMGTVVSSPFAGRDENDKFGCFFCFPDLSCRTPGSFRLQFSLVALDPMSAPGSRTPVAAVVKSDVFTVYNAKDFPGMKASTLLTKRLKEQGCLISIKKGNDKADRVRKRDDSDSNEEDADEDFRAVQRRRQR